MRETESVSGESDQLLPPPVPPPAVPPLFQKPRDPFLAAGMNVLVPGAGYWYLGQRLKAVTALVCAGLVALFTYGFGYTPFTLLLAADAYTQAKQTQNGLPIGKWTFWKSHR